MLIKEILVEGGNVFKGRTAPIKKEDITPTLEAYFAELASLFPGKAKIFNLNNFMPLGSTLKKKVSGDVDLGLSALNVLDKNMSDASIKQWGIDPAEVAALFDKLKARAKTATPEQLRMKAFLKCLAKYINENAPIIHCDETKIEYGNIFFEYPQINEKGKTLPTSVQIDWMIGNLDWLKFAYHSAGYPEGSNVKGLHRTQLLLSAFQVADLSFVHLSGVKDKQTGQIVANNPKEALKILGDRLGFKITEADTEDYYTLHKFLKSHMRPEDYNTMLNIYFKILDSTRTDIPDDLQDEWLKRRGSLNLTGKFLPDTSKLKAML